MFFKLHHYILALSCASSLNLVLGQETTPSLTPAIFTNTFSASFYTLPPSLATFGTSLTPAVITHTFSASFYTLPPSLATIGNSVVSSSSSSRTPATTSAASTSSGTRTTSQTPTGTEAAATTSSSSAAGKLDQGSWIPVVFAVVGGLHYL
ncbi:hypothetical protein BKA65DRAFT_504215, partial [Rhexocercosporidium sp. MPI-PUGE-AT-0058]